MIKCLPTDKAPGPDGFNGMFIKKCWPKIKEDFYRLRQDFYDGTIDLEPISRSYITLVPKNNNPKGVNDYMPISPLNCGIILITKFLANRLQLIILQLLHVNQYGFIKTRTIEDCLAWSFEYINQYRKSNKEIIILKLDFAKAFDTIEHQATIAIMCQMGFQGKWIQLMNMIFSSDNSAVLLNGLPGK